MLVALCLANFGIIPFSSPMCKFKTLSYGMILRLFHIASNILGLEYTLSVDKMVNQFLVPLAVPLLLFDSDLKRVVRDAGSLLIAFIVGAVSTVVGTLCAFTLIPLKSLGDQGWKVACALTSRHIGGAINL